MSQSITQWPSALPALPLEERVQRLEEALAALQDTQALEDRVTERVVHQLQTQVSAEAERMSSAPRRTQAPAAVPTTAPAHQAAAPSAPLHSGTGPSLTSLPWLLVDFCREIVAIFWMFIDLNYKMAWSTRLLTLILLPAILTSHWWLPLANVPIMGGIVDKLLDVVLAFAMFKALHREAQRYMQFRQ